MTADEFNATRWRAGIMAVYLGDAYRVAGVNFKEHLLRLCNGCGDDDLWVRFENVQIVGATK